jgi:hypothetical protein
MDVASFFEAEGDPQAVGFLGVTPPPSVRVIGRANSFQKAASSSA